MAKMKLIYDNTNNSQDLFYISKFKAPDPVIFFEIKNKKYLVLNDLEYERGCIEANVDYVLKINDFISKNKKFSIITILNNILDKFKVKVLELPYNFPSYIYINLKKNIKKNISENSIFYLDRLKKNDQEIKMIKKVMIDTEKVMKEIINIIKYSKLKNNRLIHNSKTLTSEFLISFCQKELAKYSLTCPDCIIASGYQSSLPHHHGSGPIKPFTPIVIDIFPKSLISGYYGDITRTVCKGKPNNNLLEMYNIVLKGQNLGLKILKPRISGSKVHNEILNLFTNNGFKTNFDGDIPNGFIHSTGHGLGLDIHEPPRISKVSEKMKQGYVVTVEPGLYYSKIGGIRIEDTVALTENGIKNLTKFPKFFSI